MFDIDDAIFVRSDGSPAPRMAAKIRHIAQRCHTVIVGNSFLGEFFREHADIRVVPTIIDLTAFPLRPTTTQQDEVVIGWIGTAGNLPYLAPLAPVLTELSKMHRFRVLLVCEAEAVNPYAGLPFPSELRAWSADQELAALHTFDIGLMPVPDSDWGRGKCGFKLLQYMAVGVPAVASAVGANSEIVSPGRDGLLAASPAEWRAGLGELLESRARRQELGQAARARVEHAFSLAHWVDSWVRAIEGRTAARVTDCQAGHG